MTIRYIAITSLAAHLVLSVAVAFGRLVQSDFDFTARLAPNVPTWLDPLLAWYIDLGSIEVTTAVLLTIVLWHRKKRARAAILLLYFAIGLVIVLMGKQFLHHPAPPVLFQRQAHGLTLPSSYVQIQYSYPSGHTYRFVFVMTVLALLGYRQAKTSHKRILVVGLSLAASCVLGLGLIVLGKHWATDVVGAAMLAVGLAALAVENLVRRNRRTSH